MSLKSKESLIAAWAFLLGSVLALIVGIFAAFFGRRSVSPFLLAFLALLGLVVGYFVSDKNSKTFLKVSVSLVIVSFAGIQGSVISAALGKFVINELMTTTLGALLFLFIPATIFVALKTVFSIANK